jgi:hypothetical protein
MNLVTILVLIPMSAASIVVTVVALVQSSRARAQTVQLAALIEWSIRQSRERVERLADLAVLSCTTTDAEEKVRREFLALRFDLEREARRIALYSSDRTLTLQSLLWLSANGTEEDRSFIVKALESGHIKGRASRRLASRVVSPSI